MKKELTLVGAAFAALVGLAVLLAVTALSGCASGTGQPEQCANAQKAWDAYQVRLLVGPPPTDEETRIAAAARALLILYCGAPGTAEPAVAGTKEIGTLPLPRQPKRIVTTDTGARVIYYLHTPFSILQDPTGVFRKDGSLATITVGPLYRTSDKVRSQYLWMPDQAWLQRVRSGEPTMLPIR